MNILSPPITNVNLKLIQSFLMVGEHKSFKKAAEMTGLTQSAVSAQVKAFEAQLGYQVFERTTRSVQLNEKGAQLFDVASTAFNSISGCLRSLEVDDRNEKGVLRVACSSAVPTQLLDIFWSVLSASFPFRKLELMDMLPEAIEAAVAENLVDLALTSEPSCDNLKFTSLYRSHLVAIVSASLPLEDVKIVSQADLSESPVFVQCENSEFGMISELFHPMLSEGSTCFCRMSSAERLIQMVKKRNGIGLTWEHSLNSTLLLGCRIMALDGLTKQTAVGLLSNSNHYDWDKVAKSLSDELALEKLYDPN